MAHHRALGIRQVAIGVVTAFVLVGTAAVPAHAATGLDETELTAGAAGDQYGFSVALDGDLAVVGAYLDDKENPDESVYRDSGSVYVYQRDGAGAWAATQLFAPDPAEGDQFGYSVAVDDERVVVGALRDDKGAPEAGAAYVYEPDGSGGWTGTRLTAADGVFGDLFGLSVAVDGDRVVVGAPGNDETADGAGAAYVYEPDASGTWVQAKQLAPDGALDGALDDAFGYSVAAGGGMVVVGARGDDDKGDGAGAAYVYEPDGPDDWTPSKLTAATGLGGDLYGTAVAVDGGAVVVGAPGTADSAGAAYVYGAQGAETKLTVAGAASYDFFGYSVSIDGDLVVVGASGHDGAYGNMGAAYVYEPVGSDAWAGTELTASHGATFDRYGWSVAVDGDRVVVGPLTDPDGSDIGSTWIYEFPAGGIPPVLTAPDGLYLPATTIAGAVVSYEASAIDGIDGVVAVDCDPESGSSFEPGPTIVTCTASDTAGNLAEVAFEVFVEVPTDAEGFNILLRAISGLGLPKNATTSLASPIKQALKLLTDRKTGNDSAACDKFVSFQANVGVRLAAGTITPTDAELLHAWAASLADGNSCEAP